MMSLILCICLAELTEAKHCYHVINCYLLHHLGMDRWSFEACSEFGAAKLVTNRVLAQNAYQIEFISRQEWKSSNKKVIITFLYYFIYIYFYIIIQIEFLKSCL